MEYNMERGRHPYILPLTLSFFFLLSAGCIFDVPGPAHNDTITAIHETPTPESPVATRALADIALALTDLPSDYILKDRSVTAYAGVDKIFQDLGWRQGYRVSFYRLDRDREDMTSITQEIDLYPLDTVKDVYVLKKEALLPPEDDATNYQVPFPQQGERSIAWREVRTSNTIPVVTYTVIFTKKNVYEKISMTGTSTDYESLKTLAQTAAAKIQ
jgi:hypothetical protein